MTTDRKKPTAGFWITVALVAVLVAYPLSLGPIIWIFGHTSPPLSAFQIAGWIYEPLDWTIKRSPQPISDLFVNYLALWGWKL
jgi:hypothetical protein